MKIVDRWEEGIPASIPAEAGIFPVHPEGGGRELLHVCARRLLPPDSRTARHRRFYNAGRFGIPGIRLTVSLRPRARRGDYPHPKEKGRLQHRNGYAGLEPNAHTAKLSLPTANAVALLDPLDALPEVATADPARDGLSIIGKLVCSSGRKNALFANRLADGVARESRCWSSQPSSGVWSGNGGDDAW